MLNEIKQIIKIVDQKKGKDYSSMNLSLNDLVTYFTDTDPLGFIGDMFTIDYDNGQEYINKWRENYTIWLSDKKGLFYNFVGNSMDMYIKFNCGVGSEGFRLFWSLIPTNKREKFFLIMFKHFLNL